MEANTEEKSIKLYTIFWTFYRIGFLTLGGGLAMAAVMRHELVLKRKWLTEKEFSSEMSVATIIPGAIAVNLAYLQGKKLKGKKGAFSAVLGTVLPSFIIILIIAQFAMPYFRLPLLTKFFRGCSVAVAGLLAFAAFTFGKQQLKSWNAVFVCVTGLAIVAGLDVHPVWAIVTTGLTGYILFRK